MRYPAVSPSPSQHRSPIIALARAYPHVAPVRVAVCVTGTDGCGRSFSEQTWLEFASPAEVLFASALPLDFGDRLRVSGTDGSWEAEVQVIAARYRAGKTAVAAQVERQAGELPLKKR